MQAEVATLGGGCFWCLEAVFRRLEGVLEVTCGYAGGQVPNPTYAEVSTGTTGHAEVVQVVFDPQRLSYRALLEVFFAVHDPTTRDRQGADVGPQYRSIVLYHTPEQRRVALEVIQNLEAEGAWPDPIVTEVVPLEAFYPAEAHHQRYFETHPDAPYCRAVIAPKLAKFRERFRDRTR